jgi:hypothetical protein
MQYFFERSESHVDADAVHTTPSSPCIVDLQEEAGVVTIASYSTRNASASAITYSSDVL